jgi:hypothetical protein
MLKLEAEAILAELELLRNVRDAATKLVRPFAEGDNIFDRLSTDWTNAERAIHRHNASTHVLKTPDNCDCVVCDSCGGDGCAVCPPSSKRECPVCVDSLAVCRVCGGGEIQLEQESCDERMARITKKKWDREKATQKKSTPKT